MTESIRENGPSPRLPDCCNLGVWLRVLLAVNLGGVVAACGLAQGMDFPATVAPFILRGVRLIGVDSVMCPMPERKAAWQRFATDFDLGRLDVITSEIALSETIARAGGVLAGKVRGRLVVDVNR